MRGAVVGLCLGLAALLGLPACTASPTLVEAAHPATEPSAADEPGGNGNATGAGNANASAQPSATLQGPSELGPGANAGLRALATPIEAAARTTGVMANVLAAIVWTESRADPAAAGGGLMQLGTSEFAAMQAAHPQVVGSLEEPAANVLAGAYYLLTLQASMQAKYARRDLAIVLRAYNSGENGVDPNDLTHLPAHTGISDYVARIEADLDVLRSGQGTLPP